MLQWFWLCLEDYLMGKCHNSNIGSMWCKDLPHKIYVGQWPTFHGPVILSYLEDHLMDCYTGDIDSVWHKHWTETIHVSVCQWPIFHGTVILPYILKTIWWTNVRIGILDSWDAEINHVKCMWVSDLHFMVQWFWHVLKTFWWRNVELKILI